MFSLCVTPPPDRSGFLGRSFFFKVRRKNDAWCGRHVPRANTPTNTVETRPSNDGSLVMLLIVAIISVVTSAVTVVRLLVPGSATKVVWRPTAARRDY